MPEHKKTKQKDPKRQEAARKGYEKHMQKLKEDILKNSGSHSSDGTSDGGSHGSDGTSNSDSHGSDGTSNGTSQTTFAHMYGIGAIAVLAVAVCIFVIPKLTKNLKKTAAQPEKKETPKIRRKML